MADLMSAPCGKADLLTDPSGSLILAINRHLALNRSFGGGRSPRGPEGSPENWRIRRSRASLTTMIEDLNPDWDFSACCIKGCNEPTVALGLCNKHWRRNRRYGSPVAFKSHSGMFRGMSPEDRFWVNVTFEDDGCWMWHGCTDKNGYGIFKGEVEGVTYKRAHRFSYAFHKGPIKRGLIVMHQCDTPGCVDPDHLSLGTNLDNMRDKIAKGRARVPQGEGSVHAVLTEDQVREILRDPRPYTKLAAEYGVNVQTISSIKNRDSWKHIDIEPVKGKRTSPRRGRSDRLNPERIREIRKSNEPLKKLAEKYDVSVQTICDIRKRRSWQHVD